MWRTGSPKTVAEAVERIVGPDLSIAVQTYDGGRIGPADAPLRWSFVARRAPPDPDRPGELGLGRAYVAGDLDVERDIYAAIGSQSFRHLGERRSSFRIREFPSVADLTAPCTFALSSRIPCSQAPRRLEAAMAHPNEDLVRQGFEAFSKGDMEGAAALFADDVVWHTPGRGPLAGDHRGKAQVMSMLGKQAELTGGTFRSELHDILANDEHGVLLATVEAERGGKTWKDNGVVVFHIHNGKVSEAWLHPGDEYAADEFFS